MRGKKKDKSLCCIDLLSFESLKAWQSNLSWIISPGWRLGSRSGQTPQQCFARRRAPRQSRPGGRLALGSEVRRRALEALEALCHLQTVWRRTQPGGGSGEGAEQVREGGGGMRDVRLSLFIISDYNDKH